MYAKLKTLMLAFIIVFTTISIIIFPEQALLASIDGLHTWWEIVFPSLLPFFIMAELLISFGVVQFLGYLFEPIMRPLFKVPGAGSFAWILGMVSGFPSGAKITVLLREKNDISQYEAERLLSFSNAASPLFIFGAIAVGFFHNVQLGFIIATSHYISNFIVGLLMRFHARQAIENKLKVRKSTTLPQNRLRHAFSRMHSTRIKETRPFGELLGDAVLSSVQTLLIVGGFIILFSVFTSLLQVIHLFELIYFMGDPLFRMFNISKEFITAFSTGFFEITMGAAAISQTKTISLMTQLILVSFILGFNGFSIQAQVASLIAKTDIRFYPYFLARLLHALIASLLTALLIILYFNNKFDVIDTMNTHSSLTVFMYELTDILTKYGPLLTIFMLIISCLILSKRIKNN